MGYKVKRERAYVENRRKEIIKLLQLNPELSVEGLAKELNVSVITIRRDLQILEEEKYLVRFYGGAKLIKTNQVDEVACYRELIARYAASLIEDGDSLFINTSKNALQTIKYINRRNVTVITNNGKAINCEHSPGVSIILTGGELRYPKEAMVGDVAIRNLQLINAKKAFIGCSGISVVAGMTTEIANEVSINELMISHTSQEVYILADHTKIGKNSSFTSCSIKKVKYLITDEKAPKEEIEKMKAAGVKVHQVSLGDNIQ